MYRNLQSSLVKDILKQQLVYQKEYGNSKWIKFTTNSGKKNIKTQEIINNYIAQPILPRYKMKSDKKMISKPKPISTPPPSIMFRNYIASK